MWRPVSAFSVGLLLFACATQPTPPPSTASPSVIVVPTELPNGRIEISIQPRYVLGGLTSVEVAMIATRGTITGPTAARIMASGISEGGAPSEVLVRLLGVRPTTTSGGRRVTTSVMWNGEDERGMRVPADAYVLLLDFESSDGGSTRTVQATAILQMND